MSKFELGRSDLEELRRRNLADNQIVDVLDPLMKLSLKLQKEGNTIADSLFWVEATVELLQNCKSRDSKEVSDLIESGQFEGIALKGQQPSMAYKNTMLDGFCDAINKRFQLEEQHIINATRILNFKNWPSANSDELQDFGVEEVTAVAGHFRKTLQRWEFDEDEVLNEWRMLKIVLHKRHGTELLKKSWADVYNANDEFPNINAIIDLLLTLPPTSVSCETTFSQMKLIKTSRRTRLSSTTLNNLLLVKLESPTVDNFEPDMAIDRWFLQQLMKDLEQVKPKKVQAPKKQPRAYKKRTSDITEVRRNPARSSRGNPLNFSPPMTRARRGSVSSSVSSSSICSGVTSPDRLFVRFGFFGRGTEAENVNLSLDSDEYEEPRRKRPVVIRDERSADEITEDDLNMVAEFVIEKKYDSIYGSSCHQCRQKTDDMKTICRSGSCYGIRGQFCGPCLRNRYGENVKEALKDPNWECPPCRRICNCSFCRRNQGKSSTGILIHLARERGYNNVNDYLQSLQKKC